MHIPVLDKGYVICHEIMGNDLTVVNAARASYNNKSTEIKPRDEKLIGFLARNKHFSPFRHSYFQLEFKAPLFLARQFWKHVIGVEIEYGAELGEPTFSGGFKDTGWNEGSFRYTEFKEEFYVPDEWRKQSSSNRQASDGILSYDEQESADVLFQAALSQSFKSYQALIALGVAREQARILLPQNVYTTWYWTMSLQAALHLVDLRDKPDAQWEAQQYAKAVGMIIAEHFPVTLLQWKEHAHH